ncbi:hypothetical protein GQR86_17455 [Providencia vermicola]|nr:hypothetical protein [Providencia sp. G1(2023)]MBC8654422.1 hypothetical protein [Providencia vermicola]
MSVFASPKEVDKADNAFMMIATALVIFMIVPGIALFYGGLLRSKNVLSLMAQTTVIFALVSVIWIVYGYSLAFSEGNAFFGGFNQVLLKNISVESLSGSIPQFVHVAFQGAFACLTVALVVGALGERIKFSAILIFTVIWTTFAYLPMAHMVWGGGILSQDGALDFAGGTVVHINAAVAGLVGAYLLGHRTGLGKEAIKPHNLPMVFMGTSILFVGWFGFNAGVGGDGYAEGITMMKQVGIQAVSILVCVVWTAIVAFIAFKIAAKTFGLRITVEKEREGLDITSHGESAYN